jgi:hypothetical protein
MPIRHSAVRKTVPMDRDVTGWMVLLMFPFLPMALGGLLVVPPKPGNGPPNRHGPDPRLKSSA